jgi:hypothetical protein
VTSVDDLEEGFATEEFIKKPLLHSVAKIGLVDDVFGSDASNCGASIAGADNSNPVRH